MTGGLDRNLSAWGASETVLGRRTRLRGPCVQCRHTIRGDRVNRWLSPGQVGRYRSQVERGPHPKRLLTDLDSTETLRAEQGQGG